MQNKPKQKEIIEEPKATSQDQITETGATPPTSVIYSLSGIVKPNQNRAKHSL